MDPIFRGCTRPALVLGIPLIPLVAVVGPVALGAIWATVLIGVYAWIWASAMLVPICIGLRQVTSTDDQRLLQWVHLARINFAHGTVNISRTRWYTPIESSAP